MRKFSISRRYNIRNLSKTQQISITRATRIGRVDQYKIFTKTNIDKILKIIQRKVLKGTHLPVTIKEIQVGYLNSPYFKDIYLYLAQNKLPSSKSAICKVEALAESYVLLDSLLFKLITIPENETALLAIPEICVAKIITLYHSSLFKGHQGVIKTYLTKQANSLYQILCITYIPI